MNSRMPRRRRNHPSRSFDRSFDLDSGYSESPTRLRARPGTARLPVPRRSSETDYSPTNRPGKSRPQEKRVRTESGYHEMYRSAEDLDLEFEPANRNRAESFPRSTRNKGTQTPPLEQVLLEMRMERDLRSESGDSNWISVCEQNGDPNWRQLGREMRYLADDWREYNQEIEDEGRAPLEKSVWRSILETLLYIRPRGLTPSLRRRSISMYNLGASPIPVPTMNQSRSLSSSYSNSLNGFNADVEEERRCSTSVQIRVETPRSNSFGDSRLGRRFRRVQEETEIRRRSQSFSCTGVGQSSRRMTQIEEVDLDSHLSTPYSEQWNAKHYQTGTVRLKIPRVHSRLSDDEDLTPEVKNYSTTNLFMPNDDRQ